MAKRELMFEGNIRITFPQVMNAFEWTLEEAAPEEGFLKRVFQNPKIEIRLMHQLAKNVRIDIGGGREKIRIPRLIVLSLKGEIEPYYDEDRHTFIHLEYDADWPKPDHIVLANKK